MDAVRAIRTQEWLKNTSPGLGLRKRSKLNGPVLQRADTLAQGCLLKVSNYFDPLFSDSNLVLLVVTQASSSSLGCGCTLKV